MSQARLGTVGTVLGTVGEKRRHVSGTEIQIIEIFPANFIRMMLLKTGKNGKFSTKNNEKNVICPMIQFWHCRGREFESRPVHFLMIHSDQCELCQHQRCINLNFAE